jgi:hypothetical protein
VLNREMTPARWPAERRVGEETQMQCEGCGAWAETRHVVFYYNIGLVFLRFHRSLDETLCKSCIHRSFWKFTAFNLFLGWWGVISFFCTIGFLLSNTIRYLGCLSMAPRPADGGTPPPQAQLQPVSSPGVLTQATVDQLQPWLQVMWQRLQQGAPVEQVAREYSPTTQCSEEQIALYLQALLHQYYQQQQQAALVTSQ